MFVVRGRKGAVVREAALLDSPQVGLLECGARVDITETVIVENRERCRLANGGWVSGKILEPAANEERAIVELSARALLLQEASLEAAVRVRDGRVGDLDCLVVAVARQPRRLVVLAPHCRAQDMVSVAKELLLDHGLRDAAVVLPQGPWWDEDLDDLPAIRVAAAARFGDRGLASDIEPRAPKAAVDRAVDSFLSMLEGAADLATVGPSGAFIGGFGQGATLAFEVYKSLDVVPAGVFLLSPTSLFESSKGLRRDSPFFFAHGDDDPVVPFSVALAARTSLRQKGIDLDFQKCSGGHAVTYHATRALAHFINKYTPPELDAEPSDHNQNDELTDLARRHNNRNMSFKQFTTHRRQEEDRIAPTPNR